MFTSTPPFILLEGNLFSGPVGMLIVVSVVWVFLVILPGRKEAKKKQEMLAGMKKGDVVHTQTGIIGKVVRTEEKSVVIETAGSKIEILRNTVAQVLDKNSD